MRLLPATHLPGRVLYYFDEHREQHLLPSPTKECIVRVLADWEPSIQTPWDTASAGSGFAPLVGLVSALPNVGRRRKTSWRVVVQCRPPGEVVPDFYVTGKSRIPDLEIPCDSRIEANELALKIATRFMEDAGCEVNPRDAPIRLGLGPIVMALLGCVGGLASLVLMLAVAEMVEAGYGGHSRAPGWIEVLLGVVFVAGLVLGVLSPLIVGRALLRRRRRSAIAREAS